MFFQSAIEPPGQTLLIIISIALFSLSSDYVSHSVCSVLSPIYLANHLQYKYCLPQGFYRLCRKFQYATPVFLTSKEKLQLSTRDSHMPLRVIWQRGSVHYLKKYIQMGSLKYTLCVNLLGCKVNLFFPIIFSKKKWSQMFAKCAFFLYPILSRCKLWTSTNYAEANRHVEKLNYNLIECGTLSSVRIIYCLALMYWSQMTTNPELSIIMLIDAFQRQTTFYCRNTEVSVTFNYEKYIVCF